MTHQSILQTLLGKQGVLTETSFGYVFSVSNPFGQIPFDNKANGQILVDVFETFVEIKDTKNKELIIIPIALFVAKIK